MIHRPDPNTRESIGPAEMAVLGTLLIETDSLVKLDLQGIAIGTEGFYALGFALRMQSDLTHLNLSRTGMDTAYFNDIAPGLSKCSQLTELHLGTNFLDAEAMTLLANVMTKNLGNLRVVGLRNNLMGPKGSDALEAVCLHDQITDLDLSNNRIGSQGCIKFVQLLKDTHNRLLKDTHNRTGRTGLPDSLVTLNLSFNGLDMAGAWALTEAFSCMHNLRTLKLHCEIPVAALCSKRELSLTGMGFGDIEGVIAAFLLRQNVKLRALDLRGNELGPISYRCLGTVLIGLGALRELNQHSFNSYDMTPQDVEMILRAGMQVSYRAKTPAKPSHRHTFDQVVSQTSFKMPTDAVSADEGVSHEGVDHDNYQTVFENWKASGAGTRPAARVDRAEIENELAASNIEDNDSNDSDSKNQDVVNENHGRPLDFGYYRRNARLRQKAHPRIEKKTHGSESQMASTVIKPVERSAPAAQENDSADIVESGAESSDDRRSPRTTRTKISSKNSSKNSFKKLKNSSKKLKLSIDVLSESPSTSPTFPLRERSVLSASSSLSSPLSARLQVFILSNILLLSCHSDFLI